jgi:hypothetical protein
MSPAERKIMQDHAVYWHARMAEQKVAAFGLVGDPAGAFGIGIVEVSDEQEVRSLTAGDPAILSGAGFSYSVHLMPMGAVHPPWVNGPSDR